MKLTKTTFFLGCLTGGIGAAFVPMLLTSTQAQTKLLPFQGRLTDAAGSAIVDGAKVVEFKMYDAPTGGNVKWAGEVHKLSINGGLVNTMLGSKASLGSVDFSTPSYLQITVDANTDNQITAADPPLLPRQSVVPAIYSMQDGSSRTSDGLKAQDGSFHDWSALFGSQSPATGSIPVARISLADGITAAHIASNAVGASEIQDGSISGVDIGPATVTPANLKRELSLFVDRKSLGTNGGTAIAGWQTRELNTTQYSSGTSITRTGNRIKLTPGIYLISGSCPGMDVSTHYAAFKNVTDGTVALSGTVGYADYENTNETQDRVFVRGVITVSGGDKEFELRHFTGVPAGWDYCLGMGNHTTIPPGPDGAFWIASEVYVERLN